MSSGGVTENDASGFHSTSVNIYPDATNAQLDHVDMTASTNVPTWSMKWFGLRTTTITAVSNATRRAAVVMMVLDRSGSMCSVNGVRDRRPCGKAVQLPRARDDHGCETVYGTVRGGPRLHWHG